MKLYVIVTSIVGMCVLALGWPAYAEGAASALAGASPRVVSLSGCPIEGAQTGCLIMLKKGESFDISAAPAQIDPKHPNLPPAPPQVGYWAIKAGGTVTPVRPGKCTEGAHLANITWRYSRISA